MRVSPTVETTWASWVDLHPETLVLSDVEGQGLSPEFFDYWLYPYGAYESIPVFFLTQIMSPLDPRRFGKERVIGLPSSSRDPGIAFPFGALEEQPGPRQAISFSYEGDELVLLWSDDAQGGTAFRPITSSGESVTMTGTGHGFVDEETDSTWTLDGLSISGPFEGERLVPVTRAHTAFWGAWAAFHPTTRLWEK